MLLLSICPMCVVNVFQVFRSYLLQNRVDATTRMARNYHHRARRHRIEISLGVCICIYTKCTTHDYAFRMRQREREEERWREIEREKRENERKHIRNMNRKHKFEIVWDFFQNFVSEHLIFSNKFEMHFGRFLWNHWSSEIFT